MDHPFSVGIRAREARKAEGMTLADVSRMSGIPQSTLSKFENGFLSLPVDRILKLGKALGMPAPRLLLPRDNSLEEGGALGRRSITRAGTGEFAASQGRVLRGLFPDLLQKRMVPEVQTISARSLDEFGPLLTHDYEDLIFVLEGEVQIITDVYEPVFLGPEDAMYIDGRMGHAYLNAGKGEARILVVSTSCP